MCCRHSLAGSKQGKSRDCSRSGSKQQRRQERHFLVPTSHIFFQTRPDCRPSAQGIVGVLIPRGPRFKIELVSSRSREHCGRHHSFSCSERAAACLRAASYRRGLVSAAAARPLPRQPSPTRKPGADSSSSGRTRRRKIAPPLPAPARRRPAAPRPSPARREWSQPPRLGAGSQRKPEPAPTRCIPAARRWYLPSQTFHITTSELQCKRDALLLLSAPGDQLGTHRGSIFKEAGGWAL